MMQLLRGRLTSMSAAGAVFVAALVVLIASTAVAFAAAAPIRATVGPFHFHSDDFKINSRAATDVVMAQITTSPGKSSGWHTHPGPAFVIVTAGMVTLYRVTEDGTGNTEDGICSKSVYHAGEGFVEAPGQVHISRNEGTVDAQVMATFLGVPPGAAFKKIVPAPTACPGIS